LIVEPMSQFFSEVTYCLSFVRTFSASVTLIIQFALSSIVTKETHDFEHLHYVILMIAFRECGYLMILLKYLVYIIWLTLPRRLFLLGICLFVCLSLATSDKNYFVGSL